MQEGKTGHIADVTCRGMVEGEPLDTEHSGLNPASTWYQLWGLGKLFPIPAPSGRTSCPPPRIVIKLK